LCFFSISFEYFVNHRVIAVDCDFVAIQFSRLFINPGLLSNVLNQNSLVFPMLAEVSQGMQGVLGLFGKHVQK
jgi:hypothetical protein